MSDRASPFVLPPVLEHLGIFPLPEGQLFPHALLPLHVFEPRYRALTRDCLATPGKLMAVAMLEPGFEEHYEGRPPVKAICGVGEILQSHTFPDGRYDILLRGIARVRIVEELPPHQPYRLVRAVPLVDHVEPGPALRVAHQALLALCDRLAAALPSGGDTLRAVARQESEPGPASDLIASALLTEAEERQQVLELVDVAQRLDRVSTSIAGLVAKFTPSHGTSGGGAN